MISDRPTGHAAGKIILFGEHGVVFGTPALAMALDQGMTAVVDRHTGPFRLEVPAWRFAIDITDDTVHGEALRALLSRSPFSAHGLRVTVQTEIPARAGLGSSAALAAATVRALSAHNNHPLPFSASFEAVQAWETVFHGRPSGLDATIALEGGTIRFSKAEGGRAIDARPLPLLIVHTGRPGDTRHTVARFAETVRRSGDAGQERLNRIAEIVDAGTAALESGDDAQLGELMLENHRLLSWFGVSSAELDRIVSVACSAGALGAKLTGGGGGGCAIVLAGSHSDAVRARVAEAGFRVVLP